MVMVGSRLRNRCMTCALACPVASPIPPAMTTVRFASARPKPAVPTNWLSPVISPTAAAAPNVDPIAQTGVPDLIEAHELVERVGAAVR
jgi:hypothetical protein